jgi:primosomal replication protein N
VNHIEIGGALVAREAIRYTPAGLEVFEGTFHHRTELAEAGKIRTLEFDFPAIAFGAAARRLSAEPLGKEFSLKGFIAPKSMRSSRLIVHITEYI